MADKRIMSELTVEVVTEPFHYLIIKGLFTKDERESMFNEMLLIKENNAFKNPEQSGGAVIDDINLKRNSAIFFDEIYMDRGCSSVLKYNRKTIDLLLSDRCHDSWFFNRETFKSDSTLVSYYENADYYKSHKDQATITTLSYFFKEPKRFQGGVIKFTDYDIEFEVDTETTIAFPSNIRHEVSEIKMNDKDLGCSKGRFCMNQFFSV